MSLTLLTAAYVLRACVEGEQWLPKGIRLDRALDQDTVQARSYIDEVRGRVGIAVVGTNERRDWLRNFDIVPSLSHGFRVARGWLKGGRTVAEFAAEVNAQELCGHSKGAAEAILAAWELEHQRGILEPGSDRVVPHAERIQVLALETPKPFFGTPPLMDALCLRNPRDAVCRLPPVPGWYSPGSTVVLPWDVPDLEEDHTLGPVCAALVRSGHGYLALTEREGDEPSVIAKHSRGAEMAVVQAPAIADA